MVKLAEMTQQDATVALFLLDAADDGHQQMSWKQQRVGFGRGNHILFVNSSCMLRKDAAGAFSARHHHGGDFYGYEGARI